MSESVLEKAAALRAAGRPFALVTVVRAEAPTSAKPGAKALVDADGSIVGWIGGGCAQPAVLKTVEQALADGRPRLIRISPNREAQAEEGIVAYGMSCHSGGTLEIFVDPVLPRPALGILGASPAAQALAGLAQRVGFDVTAGAPGATAALFPDAATIAEAFVLPRPVPRFVVVATQGKGDEEALEAALAAGVPRIWLIASRRKAEKLRAYLKERGHDAARADAIVAPAGLDIGAATPEEIALSVLAAVVQDLRRSAPAPAEAADVQAAAAPATDPVCGMQVDPATAKHRSEHLGRPYYFCCPHCKQAFDRNPAEFVKEEAGAA